MASTPKFKNPFREFMITLFLNRLTRVILAVSSATVILSSCTQSHLAVYTDYLSHENLASYYVGTPDPYLNCPTIGQRLIIVWSLKKKHLLYEDLHLNISIRFRNKQEITLNYPIRKVQGTYVYSLLNQDYIDADGILTYKVELIGGGCLLDEWRHQIWTNLILVGQDNKTPCEKPEEKLEFDNHIDTDDDFNDIDFS